jgi:hypothetical protein
MDIVQILYDAATIISFEDGTRTCAIFNGYGDWFAIPLYFCGLN